jgi:peptidoglycan/xylan/chitin deacetylase (PgdA/CDA1 family)
MSRSGINNVNFHGVGEPTVALGAGEAAVWLSVGRFHAALDALRGRPDVRISFDDGNRSDVEIVLPALVERGMTARFFVLAGRLDDPRHLGVSDLAVLAAAGMEIGSHGLIHRDWRRCSDHELAAEIEDSRRILRDATGESIRHVAVPFGSYDRRVLAGIRRAGGYERVFTSDGGPAQTGAWLQPRTSVTSARHNSSDHEQPRATVRQGVKRWVKRWR